MTVLQATAQQTLRIALGDYPQTAALKNKRGHVRPRSRSISPTSRRSTRPSPEWCASEAYDVSEMAIVTYLQAKSYGKPLVLLPCVMLGRFQHGTLLYNAERGNAGARRAAGQAGRRPLVHADHRDLAARHLQNDYGVDIYRVHWVNFEDAHVLEYRDPPFVERAADGKNLLADGARRRARCRHLRRRTADDPRLKSVDPDPDAETRRWHAQAWGGAAQSHGGA